MDREEIIRMAREAVRLPEPQTPQEEAIERALAPIFERFAALVAAAEREAVIAIVNDNSDSDGLCCTDDLLAAIRARGNT